jgi:hypothetical protein
VSNDPIEDFFKWLENEIKFIRQQIEILIANNPQIYVKTIEWYFDFLKTSIETYKPIAVQNARNYTLTLREQYKIYDNNMKFFTIPTFPYINPLWTNIMTSKT